VAGLYGRVTARGFPSVAAAGQTGEGAAWSQGGTQDPAHGQAVSEPGKYSTLPGFPAEAVSAPQVLVDNPSWGLPGTLTEPDQTPRTHAAPLPGWAGSYNDGDALAVLHQNSMEIHGVDFGALARHTQVIDETVLPMDPSYALRSGDSIQQPVRGQLQNMGGRDIVQGYGKLNDYGFSDGHRARPGITGNMVMSYVDPAERALIVPQASGSYVPVDAVQGPGPYSSFWDSPGIISAEPPSYSPPAQPEPGVAPVGAQVWSSHGLPGTL